MNFSSGWFKRFSKRNSFSIRKWSSKSIKPSNLLEDSKREWIRKIRQLVRENVYDPQFIIKYDETGVHKDAPAKTTIDTIGKNKMVINSGGIIKFSDYSNIQIGKEKQNNYCIRMYGWHSVT